MHEIKKNATLEKNCINLKAKCIKVLSVMSPVSGHFGSEML